MNKKVTEEFKIVKDVLVAFFGEENVGYNN